MKTRLHPFFRITFSVLILSLFTISASAQADQSVHAQASATKTHDDHIPFDPDHAIESEHEVTILGQKVPYKATTGMMPVWNADGHVEAGVFYVYYERTDVKDKTKRPIVFSFNGGPGSASLWMHLGYTGPRILHIDDEGYPLQPYGVKDNPYSILDVADIVFVDPVNTGFSRIVDKDVPRDRFFSVNGDVRYLSEWVSNFTSRQGRWASPKYLIGESYGTVRVSGMALALQQREWMHLNGVILVSPTDLGISRDGPVAAANYLPYYAATAWYHDQLDPAHQNRPLTEFLSEVEAFTIDELLPAIAKGATMPEETRLAMAQQMAEYTSIEAKTYLQHNLAMPTSYFWKELLRDEGYTVGRLDSRYKGIDAKDAGDRPDYNAELSSWEHSFTPAINIYLRDELGYTTDLKYNVFGPVHPWDRSGNNTGANLRLAMAENPYLHVLTQAGYYDGATDYFNAKFNMWHLDPSGKMQDRISFEGYESGHMMYLRYEDLRASNQSLREFIQRTIPATDEPAKY
jgi:carboxypeptidase C (cathepsin A)